jgi:hypothetical protein
MQNWGTSCFNLNGIFILPVAGYFNAIDRATELHHTAIFV